MGTLADATLISSSPGRLRIGLAGLYRNPALKAQVEALLSKLEAVTEAIANPLTGRVLVLYRPTANRDALLREMGISSEQTSAQAVDAPGAASGMRERYPPWHLREADEALAFHASSERSGLSHAEAGQRLRDGGNIVPVPKGRSSADILLSQFRGAPIALLGASAAISLLTGALAEAIALGAVLVMNTVIGYKTERQAEATISSLAELAGDHALVLRAGETVPVESAHIVPGDILLLGPGTRIAADVRLLRANGLKVDESALTGESMPVDKAVRAIEHPVPLAERVNMAYRGTAVVAGNGHGLVVGTGERTEAGAIDALARSTGRRRTPLEQQLDRLGNQLLAISTVMCLGVVAAGLLRGHQRSSLFRSVIALAVAAIPEGLPATATTSLVKGLRRLREHNVLMRHLYAVEAIGAISNICLDKTGTLTMNRMSAVEVRTQGQRYASGEDGIELTLHAEALDRLLEVCVLCHEDTDEPSSTEAALAELAEKGQLDAGQLRERFPLLQRELRTEGRNHMRTVHEIPGTERQLVAVKGSPEEVLDLCGPGADTKARILQQNEEMARAQLRVLGFAYAVIDPRETRWQDAPLTWLGLVGLADPLRPDARRVIERFHRAGIRTTMLTGDQAGTAYEIGKSLHLNNGDELEIINSSELDQLEPEKLNELAGHAHIFSRVTPADKLRIVRAIQGSGAVVAMTGDGINDSPALRAADIGIAMGSGTKAALAVADMALQFDQLDALLDAVAQGRTISDNIRKSVHFLVSSNLSEILVMFGGVAMNQGVPLSPLQLLWLNLLTDLLPAIALAEEPTESDVLQRPPRDIHENLIRDCDLPCYMRESAILAAGTLSAHAYGVLRYGAGARAATIDFNTLMLSQLLHALFCRFERQSSFSRTAPKNPRLSSAIGISAGLHGLAHLIPGLRRLLGLHLPGPLDLLVIATGAAMPLLVNEMGRGKPGRAAN